MCKSWLCTDGAVTYRFLQLRTRRTKIRGRRIRASSTMAGCPCFFIAIVVFWSMVHFQDAASEVTTGGTHGLHRENESKESRHKRQAGVDGKFTQIQEELTSIREADNSLQCDITALLTRIDERERVAEDQSRVLISLRNDTILLQGARSVSRDDFEQLERKLETLVGLLFCNTFQYQSSCYHIVREKLTWNAAKGKCRELGGKLAEIESSGENDYIRKIAQLETEDVWLGGTDQETVGNWVWASSNKVMEYTNWAKDEPNNLNMNEHCLDFHKNYNYYWNDIDCQYLRKSVCEISRASL